jgi:hypothetical protein
MLRCPELKALTDKLDELELTLTHTADERAELQSEIAAFIERLQLHRESHSGCDFHPTVQ